MIAVCKRLNNSKRSNLLVNTVQAKHVPCKPSEAFSMFTQMATEVQHLKNAERTLVVGFAETATAIGMHVARSLNLPYIHTTREMLSHSCISFKEAHSHAPQHNLFVGNLFKYDHILFVEDEVTTGNTILAAIEALDRHGTRSYTVLSYVNCMSVENKKCFEQAGVDVRFCTYVDPSYAEGEAHYCPTSTRLYTKGQAVMKHYVNVVGVDPRYGVSQTDYSAFLDRLKGSVPPVGSSCKMLVLGTEECMYPTIWLGAYYEAAGHEVLTHSTSRSTIHVEKSAGYPLTSRYDLRSMYDEQVNTYVYNLQKYDKVVIVTDANTLGSGSRHLLKVLREAGNTDITLVQITYGDE